MRLTQLKIGFFLFGCAASALPLVGCSGRVDGPEQDPHAQETQNEGGAVYLPEEDDAPGPAVIDGSGFSDGEIIVGPAPPPIGFRVTGMAVHAGDSASSQSFRLSGAIVNETSQASSASYQLTGGVQ